MKRRVSSLSHRTYTLRKSIGLLVRTLSSMAISRSGKIERDLAAEDAERKGYRQAESFAEVSRYSRSRTQRLASKRRRAAFSRFSFSLMRVR